MIAGYFLASSNNPAGIESLLPRLTEEFNGIRFSIILPGPPQDFGTK